MAVAKPVAVSIVTSEKIDKGDLFSVTPTREILSSTHTEQLVIALCGPIGSPLHEVATKLKEMLKQPFGYIECDVIRLSQFIQDHADASNRAVAEIGAQRVRDLISLGNEMRNGYGHSVLAELAVNQIRVDRQLHGKDEDGGQYVTRRKCHIIDSIKNQEELDLLRTVYRESLYVVGVFAPVEHRINRLQEKGFTTPDIAGLMDRDSGEELSGGQTVGETFPQCDFFLRMDTNTDTQLRSRVERFLHLIMDTKIITPTRAETAMYAAATAAGSSACLSRQVGAAVTDDEGEVLAIGWNDVPKAFGDLYVSDLKKDPNGDQDKRCWNHGGKCYNDEEKALLSDHVIEALKAFIPENKRKEAAMAVVGNKRLRGLIEFSRSIHAEMHAILTALRQTGGRVRGGSLYVTTYPCHSCARHIVAAGIKFVYFIEPYKKSLAIKLHGDAITENEKDQERVQFLPYDGVAPSRYLSLFRMAINSRKKNGIVIRVDPTTARPKLEKSLEALPALEGLVVKSLQSKKLVPDGASTGDGE
ncbi:MAG: deoxycytidylate deaminase [Hylemonella sp.]|nr:deoxycytidylate deaminase [Hylemonella sp.]